MGFPSPADDFIDVQLDLNDYLVKHKSATYFIRVENSGMKGVGIMIGDLLIVDRSIELFNGAVVVAANNGEYSLKRAKFINGKFFLLGEPPFSHPIAVTEGDDFQIFGVVKHVVRSL